MEENLLHRHLRLSPMVYSWSLRSSVPLLLAAGHDVIYPEEEDGSLDGGLEDLELNSKGLPDAEAAHVRELPTFSIDSQFTLFSCSLACLALSAVRALMVLAPQ